LAYYEDPSMLKQPSKFINADAAAVILASVKPDNFKPRATVPLESHPRLGLQGQKCGAQHSGRRLGYRFASRFIRASLTTAPWSILQGQPHKLAKRGGIVLASGSKGAPGERHGSLAGENSAVATA
jgi:hypothetical protein